MSITNFHEKVYEVNNDIPYLVHQLFSAVDLLRIVVEKSEDEGLLESCRWRPISWIIGSCRNIIRS